MDIDERAIEIWQPGKEEPERLEETVTWRVAGRSFELPLEELFRAL